MPQDLFEKHGIDPNAPTAGQGKDLFTQAGIQQQPVQSIAQQQNSFLPQALQSLGFTNQRRTLPEVLQGMANHPITQGILGAGDEMAKMWSFGKSQPQFGQGAAYQLGKIPGGILGYATAAAATGGAAPAGSLLSGLMEAKGVLGGLRGIAGAGLAGAAITPENRLLGGATGAGLGLLGETVGPLLKAGTGTVKKVYSAVKNKLAKEESLSNQFYNPIHEKFNGKNVYEAGEKGKYHNIDEDLVGRHYNENSEVLHNTFKEKPIYENADALQKSLGEEIGALKAKEKKVYKLTGDDSAALKTLRKARNTLKDDIKGMMGKTDPNAISAYEQASEHFLNNVVPNRELYKTIYKMGAHPKTGRVIKAIEDAQHFHKPLPEETEGYLSLLKKGRTREKIGKAVGITSGLSLLGGLGKHMYDLAK